MNSAWRSLPRSLSVVLLFATAFAADPPQDVPASAVTLPDESAVSLTVAKDRAKLMHNIYAATLDVMHDRYFHADRAIIPARAMEDVFSEMQRQTKVEARWIAVSFKPMSVTHEADSDFEKRAAKEIAAGKTEVETVEDGFYRRIGAIPLGTNCISCHNGFFRKAPAKPKFGSCPLRIGVSVIA